MRKIANISITNLAGFDRFSTTLPAIALIEGQNGEGKTSLLDATRYTFDRGHDPDIIHGDAESGEIIVEFDDGSAVKARASRKTNETTRGYRAPGATRFTVGREQIDAMANAVSYDALRFMDLTEKEQVETLLRIMPIAVSQEELMAAVGDAEAEAQNANLRPGMNGLEIIQAIDKAITEIRRDINVAADTQEKHAAELERTMPPAAPEGQDWASEAKRLRAERATVQEREREDVRQINQQFQDAKQGADDELTQAVAHIRKELDAAIKRLEQEARAQEEMALKKCNERVDIARKIGERLAEEAREKHKPALEKATADLATAEERDRQHQQAEGARKAAARARLEAGERRAKSAALTAAKERLADLKKAVAAKLPISGVTIEDGRILDANATPFGRWNTEAQIRFCLRIAVLAHGEAGFICLDGIERFDSKKREGLVRTARKYAETQGLQFIMAKVSDCPLTVTEAK